MKARKSIHFASSNAEKIFEARQILGKLGITVIPEKMELGEIRSEDQREVALDKAKTAFNRLYKPVIVEDTGIYFNAYRNFPGAFPSFMFGALGYPGLLKLLEGKERSACFKTIVAYYDGKIAGTFEGICRGNITDVPDEPKYRNPALPYEAIFIPDGKSARFCRMSKAQKAEVSHRARALRKFAEWFLKQ